MQVMYYTWRMAGANLLANASRVLHLVAYASQYYTWSPKVMYYFWVAIASRVCHMVG